MSHPIHKNHARQVEAIFWPDTDDEKGTMMRSSDDLRMTFISEYLGDHSENWIKVVQGGVETSRHNTRFIESIVWST